MCSGAGTATLAASAVNFAGIDSHAVQATGTWVSIVVSGTATGTSLPTFTVKRPCYLVNTRDETVSDVKNQASFAMTMSESGSPPVISYLINGAKFSSATTYLKTFATGQLLEFTLTGTNAHPFHPHVNAYQITALSGAAFDSNYFQVRIQLITPPRIPPPLFIF